MNLLDPIPMALWSLSLYISGILLVLEWRKRDRLRQRVALWIAVRLHLLRDALGRLEARLDDEAMDA